MEHSILSKKTIKLQSEVNDKHEAIKLAGELLLKNGYVTEEYISSMLKREDDLSTYMGNYIAIPHGTEGSQKYILRTGISIVQLKDQVNFGTDTEPKMVKVIFGISGVDNEHLEILSKIAIFAMKEENIFKLSQASTKEEILKLLDI